VSDRVQGDVDRPVEEAVVCLSALDVGGTSEEGLERRWTVSWARDRRDALFGEARGTPRGTKKFCSARVSIGPGHAKWRSGIFIVEREMEDLKRYLKDIVEPTVTDFKKRMARPVCK